MTRQEHQRQAAPRSLEARRRRKGERACGASASRPGLDGAQSRPSMPCSSPREDMPRCVGATGSPAPAPSGELTDARARRCPRRGQGANSTSRIGTPPRSLAMRLFERGAELPALSHLPGIADVAPGTRDVGPRAREVVPGARELVPVGRGVVPVGRGVVSVGRGVVPGTREAGSLARGAGSLARGAGPLESGRGPLARGQAPLVAAVVFAERVLAKRIEAAECDETIGKRRAPTNLGNPSGSARDGSAGRRDTIPRRSCS